jgi:hypothetical protein
MRGQLIVRQRFRYFTPSTFNTVLIHFGSLQAINVARDGLK